MDYFREVEALPQSKDLPTVDDELYVKTHRGTFTTDSQVKRDNRRSEVLLMNAEKFSLLASQFGQPYPQEHIQKLWEKVLFGQVHDNIDGSAFAEVYRDAATDYGDIRHDGGKILNSALSTIAKHVNTQGQGQAVLIFNPLPWERNTWRWPWPVVFCHLLVPLHLCLILYGLLAYSPGLRDLPVSQAFHHGANNKHFNWCK